MTTGDQALPQPPEMEASAAIPAMPHAVLEREALLRSFRWVFLVRLGLMLFYAGSNLYDLISYGGLTELVLNPHNRAFLIQFVVWNSFCVGECVLLFYLLSRPRLRGDLVAAGLLIAEIAVVSYGAVMMDWDLARMGDEHLLRIAYLFLLPVAFMIALGVVLWLSFTGPGWRVYSREGVAYFRAEGAERLPERFWLGATYLLFCAIQIGLDWLVSRGITP
jgi:hypothetical protein